MENKKKTEPLAERLCERLRKEGKCEMVNLLRDIVEWWKKPVYDNRPGPKGPPIVPIKVDESKIKLAP